MSVYTIDAAVNSGHLTQSEVHLYGSSRLGIWSASKDLTLVAASNYTRGSKFFELSNHLGNVLVTVSDKKIGHDAGNGTIDYYIADIITANDYYPGGMQMPGRKYSAGNSFYRYGFQTQEKVNEIAGEGNHYTAQFWEYDPRIGRRWNLDPVDQISISNYAALGNNPIYYTDFLGDRITPKSDWTEDGRKGGRYSHLNLFLVNAMMGEDDDPNNKSGRNCSMCCLNALNSNLNFLYSRHLGGTTKLKVASDYNNAMKAIAKAGYKGDREIAKVTYKGKVATSSDAATLKSNMSSSDFNTGIADNLVDQMKGNAGTFMFGVGIAQGYHSTIIMGMNNGQKMSGVIGADGKVMEGEQTASAKNPLFSFVEDGGGVRFFTAQGLENKMKEFVVGAANYYSGNKVIDGKKVSNTAPKNISTTIDNLEYKK